jgi:putative aldouronate transport system permease protein
LLTPSEDKKEEDGLMKALEQAIANRVSTKVHAQTIIVRVVKTLRKDKMLYFMFLIPLVYLLFFKYWPMYGVVLAFKKFRIDKGILGSPWVGFDHFSKFLSDPYSYKLIRNTVLLRLFYLSVGFPAPIVLALLLNELTHERFKRFVQTASYLPHFLSLVIAMGMVVNFLSARGLINQLIESFGSEPKNWLMLPEWFRTIYIVSGIWQHAGWSSIIYLAALTAINPMLYEAALVDGANRLQRLFHVTIPGIMPTVIIMFILRVGQIMTVGWQKVFLLYTGATYETADVLGTYIYRRGIQGADFGFATAVGLFQAVVGLVFLIASNALARRASETSLW